LLWHIPDLPSAAGHGRIQAASIAWFDNRHNPHAFASRAGFPRDVVKRALKLSITVLHAQP
jgi:hypothetical protein